MARQLCPACGCVVGSEAYEKDSVLYCCEPCAKGSQCQCECGCCAPEHASAKEEEVNA